MDFHFQDMRLLLLAGALGGFVWPAQAQNAAAPASQPIIFSSSVKDTLAGKAPTGSADMAAFNHAVQMPSTAFNFDSVNPVMPLPQPVAPVISPAEGRRLQELLDRRRNWASMTPAQILDVTTPENAFQLPGQNEDNKTGLLKDKNTDRTMAQAGRYGEMRNRPDSFATNAFSTGNNSSSPWLSDSDGSLNPDARDSARGGTAQPLSRFFNAANFRNNLFGNQDGMNDWSRPFNSGQPVSTTPSPAQQLAMAQFRQLLESGSPAAAAPAGRASFKTQTSGTFFRTAGNGGFNSLMAPMGISSPLATLPVLRSLNAQNDTASPLAPSWAPQAAPWTSQTPQPFTVPQRKF